MNENEYHYISGYKLWREDNTYFVTLCQKPLYKTPIDVVITTGHLYKVTKKYIWHHYGRSIIDQSLDDHKIPSDIYIKIKNIWENKYAETDQ
jgi:hypothetical protein